VSGWNQRFAKPS